MILSESRRTPPAFFLWPEKLAIASGDHPALSAVAELQTVPDLRSDQDLPWENHDKTIMRFT